MHNKSSKELTSVDGVSVVICCYNSAWVISKTLESLARQKTDAFLEWEIIAVDNNSSDQTREIIKEFKHSSVSLKIRIVHESNTGLSHARITGYQCAKYNVIIFCDDDTLLCPEYVETAKSLIESRSEIALCGGLGEAVFETVPDPRILPFMDQYATGRQGPEAFSDITQKGYVFGAGMVVKKNVLDLIFSAGFQFQSTGRKGNVLLGGEDVELGLGIKAAGYLIYYSERLKYQHLLPSRRLTWEYLNRMAFGNGYSSVMIFWPTTIHTIKSHPIYKLLWIYCHVVLLGTLALLGKASDSELLKFSGIRGAFLGIHAEFFKLFKKRLKVREYYKEISTLSLGQIKYGPNISSIVPPPEILKTKFEDIVK